MPKQKRKKKLKNKVLRRRKKVIRRSAKSGKFVTEAFQKGHPSTTETETR